MIKKEQMYKNKYFYFILFVLFILFSELVYLQLTKHGMSSDVIAHFQKNLDGRKYSMLHFTQGILFKFKFIPKEILYALMLALCNIISIIIVRGYLFKKYGDIHNKYLLDFISLTLFMVSMIHIVKPITDNQLYRGIGTPNPWHNPTYTFAKPLAILMFIFFIESLQNYYANKSYIKELLGVSLFSVLCMWAKPSFLFTFIPTCMIYLLIELFRTKFHSLKYSLCLGIAYIPSVLIIFYQKCILFDSTGNTIVFKLGGHWSNIVDNIPLAMILGCAFPLYVTAINIKKLSRVHKLTLLNYIVSAMQFGLLIESGSRANHGNFAWGYMFSMFFMFFITTQFFYTTKDMSKIKRTLGNILYGYHLLWGIMYFTKIFLGGTYR